MTLNDMWMNDEGAILFLGINSCMQCGIMCRKICSKQRKELSICCVFQCLAATHRSPQWHTDYKHAQYSTRIDNICTLFFTGLSRFFPLLDCSQQISLLSQSHWILPVGSHQRANFYNNRNACGEESGTRYKTCCSFWANCVCWLSRKVQLRLLFSTIS